MRAACTLIIVSGWLATAAGAAEPSVPRQQALVRMVRQDCGSCHGMRLTGGLGPALTPQALADKPLASMTATIFDSAAVGGAATAGANAPRREPYKSRRSWRNSL